MPNGGLETRLELSVMEDDLLELHGLHGVGRYDKIARVLHINHQLTTTAGWRLAHSIDFLRLIVDKHLVADFDLFVHNRCYHGILRPQQFFVARKALAGRSLQHAAPGATPPG